MYFATPDTALALVYHLPHAAVIWRRDRSLAGPVPLADIIDPVCRDRRLNEIFRQAGESRIVQNAPSHPAR